MQFRNPFISELIVGNPPTSGIVISNSPLPPFGGVSRIALYSGDPQEVFPAIISNFQNAGYSWFEIDTSDDGFGINQLIGLAPHSLTDSGGWLFATTSSGSAIGLVVLDVDMQLQMQNQNFLNSLASTTHPFQIGLNAGINLRADKQQMQAMNNGVAAVLFFNRLGGDVQIGDTGTISDLVLATGGLVSTTMTARNGADSAIRSTASITYVTAANTAGFAFPYPPSRTLIVVTNSWASSSISGNDSFMSFEVRDTNAAGTLRFAAQDGTACKTQDTLSQSISFTVPIGALPQSGTGFIQPMFRSNIAGNTASFQRTRVVTLPSP